MGMRREMWKRSVSAVSCAVLVSLLCASVMSASPVYSDKTEKASIEDQADLLDEWEEENLLEMAAELSEETGFEIRLVTTDLAGGMSTQEYAENYFESLTSDGPDEASGGSYVIDMDNREFYVATYGKLQYYLTDSRLDTLLDNAYDAISGGDYEATFESMLEDTEDYYRRGIQDGTRIYNEDTGTMTVYHKPKEITPGKVLAALLGGLAGFLTCFLGVKGSYSMSFSHDDGFSAADNVRLRLTGQEDRLVNHFITSRRLPRNDPGSGGSGHSGGGFTTTHTTSGGYSAGGGGRKF